MTQNACVTNPLVRRLPYWAWDVLGVVLFVGVLTGLAVRQSHLAVIPGEPVRSHELGRNGMADFRDVIYYPLQAVRTGINPYDCGSAPLPDGTPRYRQRYPALNLFPLYSPLVLLLHWPFGYFDFATSAVLYILFSVGLLLMFTVAAWRCAGILPSVGHVTILASIILTTQAGRANFLGGETAVPLAMASLAAVALAPTRPRLAGFALAIASFKPTFGLPLGIMLLACHYYRTVALGWGLGFLVGVAGLALIFSESGDMSRIVEILRENQQVLESDPEVDAQHSSSRVDSAGALQRLLPVAGRGVQILTTVVILGIAGAALWRLGKLPSDPPVRTLTMSIVCLATVASMYHLTYDAVLLWAPITSVFLAPVTLWPGVSRRWRYFVGGLLLTPMLNILPTATVQRWLGAAIPAAVTFPSAWSETAWTLVCALNGLALLAALILLTWHGCRLQPAVLKAAAS